VIVLCLVTAALAQEARVGDVSGPIELDGHLDEADWAQVQPITDFLKFQPVDGEAPAGTTEVRFLQDERYLYIGVRVRDTDYRVRARISPREAINADDQVGIYLDTFHDQRSGYIFYFNPLGIQQDIRQNNGNWNFSWSTAYRSRGHATENGYEIEVAMPWRSLKYQPGGEQTWGAIITRKVPSEGAKYAWPRLERNHPALFSQAGQLHGVRPNAAGSGLELIPALTAAQTWPREEVGRREDPMSGVDPVLQVVRPSLDARFGITPDLGLTATLNPDFSQVESDVSDVRLNARFAFRFPETRPFFLDGSEFYDDRSDSLYTRSVNEPLYGAKASGREGPWSVGALNTLDLTPLPTFSENETPGFEAADVDGRDAMTTVFRLRRDVADTGVVGATVIDKRVLGTPENPGTAGTHQAVALDANLPLGGRWFIAGSTLQTFTGAADADVRWGQGNEIAVSRAPGVGTGFNARVSDTTPGLRQETGYRPQSGVTSASTLVDHTFTSDGVVQTYTPELTAGVSQERNGEHRHTVGTAHEWVLGGVHTVDIGGEGSVQAEGTPADSPADAGRPADLTQLYGWGADLGYAGQIGSGIEVAPQGSVARTLDFATLTPATTTNLRLQATLRPTTSLRLDGTTTLNRHVPDGATPERSMLIRGRATWQFSRSLGLRLVEEHISGTLFEAPQLASSALLTWLDVPGTAIYLGYSETASLTPYTVSERTVFAKASILLRP
jgi:hypothetical protein